MDLVTFCRVQFELTSFPPLPVRPSCDFTLIDHALELASWPATLAKENLRLERA